MFKKLRKNEKGFTLAELLIVVAIIGVLVAISIPIFTSQLEKAREATDMANLRAAYAEVTTAVLTGTTPDASVTGGKDTGYTKNVDLTQEKAGWVNGETPKIGNATLDGAPKDGKVNTATVAANKDGVVTIKFN